MIGFLDLRNNFATSASSSVIPVRASQTNKITSASRMAICACSRMETAILSVLAISIPPVSIITNSLSSHSEVAYKRSRVTPGISSTMEIRSLANTLNRVDLPTFGLPTMATIGFDIVQRSSYFLVKVYKNIYHKYITNDIFNKFSIKNNYNCITGLMVYTVPYGNIF